MSVSENKGADVSAPKVRPYDDRLDAEVLDDLQLDEYGYKFRILDGVVMPPYITPRRYLVSRTLETRAGDVCFTSYPKSGSTWLSYVLLLIVNNGERPSKKTLRDCLHWVASSWPYPRSKEELDGLPSPRIFKSHMPYQMAFGGDPVDQPCKHIYIARNPKDVFVSYFHFESGKNWSGNYSGPWEHFLAWILEGKIQRGDWFDHVLSWWNHRNADNILFLKYEDLKRDFDTAIHKMAEFLDISVSASLMKKIKNQTEFETMKSDSFSNLSEIAQLGGFFRKGQIGSWKDLFTVAQSEHLDRVYAERMKGSGLDFDFE